MSSQSTLHQFIRILQPSFSSSVLVTLVTLATILGLLSPSLYNGSEFARYFDSVNVTNSTGYEKYQAVSNTVNTSEFAAGASVFVVWMVIGLLAYSIASALVKLTVSFQRFITDVEYFKADRDKIAREALLHLVVRVAAIFGLYALLSLFMSYGLAYLFLFAHAALTESWLVGIWNVLLITLLAALSVHVSVVLLRITLLRVRVFFDRYYVAED